MDTAIPFKLGDSGPELYERYKVPQLFGPMAERFVERLPLHAGQRVLDVACGTGIVARLVRGRVGPSGRVAGVDIHESMLAVARAQARGSEVSIEWKRADAANLPFADSTFDAVLCQQGLQFFSDRLRALREMHRLLIPGGVLGLCVFGPASRYNRALAEGLSRHAGAAAGALSLAAFALADRESLRSLVAEAGFGAAELDSIVLTRRVLPSQEWLLQDTGGTPHGPAVAGLSAATRAALVREIAAKLKELWDRDGFAVPTEVNVVCARK